MSFFKKHGGEIVVAVGTVVLTATFFGRPWLEDMLKSFGFQMFTPIVVNVLLLFSLLLIIIGVVLYVFLQKRIGRP